jgi:hypothetical protein
MIVLFKNIPESTYHNDISNFIQPVIKGGLFRTRGYINSIEIIALQEINTVSLEFQALANIEPDTVADRVIKNLHGLNFRGRRIVVRQYILRSWKNDKRSEENNQSSPLKERRTNLSRRRNLKTYKIALPDYR